MGGTVTDRRLIIGAFQQGQISTSSWVITWRDRHEPPENCAGMATDERQCNSASGDGEYFSGHGSPRFPVSSVLARSVAAVKTGRALLGSVSVFVPAVTIQSTFSVWRGWP
jgi:hypothetical protein